MEINKIYLQKEVIDNIKQTFQSSKKIQLQEFFEKEFFCKIKRQVTQAKYKKYRNPLKYSYSKARLPLRLNSNVIAYILAITGTKVKKIKFEPYFLSWRDYTILSDKEKKSSLDIVIDFTKRWDDRYGGLVVYTNNNENFHLAAKSNTLSLIRTKNTKRFFQYVNHLSNKKGRFFALATLNGPARI